VNAWLIESDGTAWPCTVINHPAIWPGTRRVVDQNGAHRTIPAERVRSAENIDETWRPS
jgi:hypothetical protein